MRREMLFGLGAASLNLAVSAASRYAQSAERWWTCESQLVPWNRDNSPNSRAGHPGWRRCSSLTYAQ